MSLKITDHKRSKDFFFFTGKKSQPTDNLYVHSYRENNSGKQCMLSFIKEKTRPTYQWFKDYEQFERRKKKTYTTLGRSRKTKAPLFAIARGVWTTFFFFFSLKNFTAKTQPGLGKNANSSLIFQIWALYELHPLFHTIVSKTHTHTLAHIHFWHVYFTIFTFWFLAVSREGDPVWNLFKAVGILSVLVCPWWPVTCYTRTLNNRDTE